MITPKQIETSQSGSSTRHTRKTRHGKPPAGKRKQVHEPRSASKTDPLFNALRDELGL